MKKRNEEYEERRKGDTGRAKRGEEEKKKGSTREREGKINGLTDRKRITREKREKDHEEKKGEERGNGES